MMNNNLQCSRPPSVGFTLLEVLVVIGIVAVLMVAGATVATSGFEQQLFMRRQNDALEEAKRGIEVMVEEIREAADGDNGAYPIELADDYTFIIFSDIDVDAITERVRYFVENEELKKGTIEPSGVPLVYNSNDEIVVTVASFVVNQTNTLPVFRYYNKDYPGDLVNNPLSTPATIADVTLVEVRLLVNTNPVKAPDNLQIDSFVQIRNVKSNL